MILSNIGLRMGGASRAVFAAQGVFLLGNAFYTILYPSSAANLPNSSLRGAPNGVVQCIGLTSFTLGTYYLISAYQRNSAIMAASVPSRFVAAFVMYQAGENWIPVSAFEISMGIVAGAALLWDRCI
ncbi:hypothetical protein N7481_000481 [Penicillium waksmanii]|uniref:uncharacterized protein n=1 Tax=Penicillium waksmanii TaxID=69791 RepID=UPI00254996F1|nr:uncharacterized protein N7481_000481 [Penicillium waksmanii]KAJ6000072.1 hypothetical protein N7481_000481 [Penicillium waksmanii]